MKIHFEHLILETSKKIYKKFFPFLTYNRYSYMYAEYTEQAASDQIKKILEANAPCMIARFGSIELRACETFYNKHDTTKSVFCKTKDYINGKREAFFITREILDSMRINTGFFSVTAEELEQFYILMLSAMKNVDILGSWLINERVFDQYLKKTVRVRLPDLEPYYHASPWTQALKNKKVLVIHPFAKTIEAQYKKRKYLFDNQFMLPDFSLQTIQAVQSIAGNAPDNFNTWFDALFFMQEQIRRSDFDIAIIGCGAYGFLLANYIKKIGKKSVHLGGATQLLFGIKGKRWDNHPVISKLYNDAWVYPDASEYPKNHTSVENGAYW